MRLFPQVIVIRMTTPPVQSKPLLGLIQETLGGAMGIRTPDLLNAIEALYQLSYDPKRLVIKTRRGSVTEVRN